VGQEISRKIQQLTIEKEGFREGGRVKVSGFERYKLPDTRVKNVGPQIEPEPVYNKSGAKSSGMRVFFENVNLPTGLNQRSSRCQPGHTGANYGGFSDWLLTPRHIGRPVPCA